MADDELIVLGCLGQLTLRLDQERLVRTVELTRPRVARPVLDRADQVVHREVAGGHRRGIGLDPQGGLGTVHRDLADSGQDADPLADLGAGVVVQLAFRRRVAGQGHVENRLIVGIRLAERGRGGQIDRQLSLGLRDRGLHVGGRGIQALGEGELQDEARASLTAARGHQLESRNLHELTLERRGDVVGHRLGRCAGIPHLNLDDRIVDSRQVVDRQAPVGQHTKQDHGHGQDDRHHGTTDEGLGQAHDVPPATCTLAPGITVICPVTTTRSPAATPFVTTTSSP